MNYVRPLALCLLALLFFATLPIMEFPFLQPALPMSKAAVAPRQCPTVKVHSPYEVIDGAPLTFTALVSGGDNNVTPTYNWSVSAGTISSGQGTSVITVDTTGVGGSTITATVDVGGFNRECSTSQSSTASVMKKAPPSRKVAEFGKVKLDQEKAVLDAFAIELQNDPTATGYLMVYGGRQSSKKEIETIVNRAWDYLLTNRRIDARRILPQAAGYRENLTVELWLVPDGAALPDATPTVDPKDVKPIPEKPTTKPAPPKKSKKS
jgi:hypothetical protein